MEKVPVRRTGSYRHKKALYRTNRAAKKNNITDHPVTHPAKKTPELII